jgi:hypothetical protein
MMDEVWEMLIGRDHGPLAFRVIIQPLVAAFLAIRAGLRDAREDRPAYAWAITTDPTQRRELIRQGCKDVGQLFAVAFVIDFIYEIIVFRWIYVGQALIVAVTLALLPYILIRELSNRWARWWFHSEQKRHASGRPQ